MSKLAPMTSIGISFLLVCEDNSESFSEEELHPKNVMRNVYFKGDFVDGRSEPKVSSLYETNYTKSEGEIAYNGTAYKNYKPRYGHDTDYNSDLTGGGLVYYEDDTVGKYNSKFGINRELVRRSGPNGVGYNSFTNKNEKDQSDSKHGQNIMLKRNDNILASMNHIMKND